MSLAHGMGTTHGNASMDLAAHDTRAAAIQKVSFGKMPDGTPVEQYRLKNKKGVEARFITYGATWTNMLVPDRNGTMGDVLLGFDDLAGYLNKDNPYFGATIGRFANRIAKGKFSLDGKSYTLPVNNGPNSLHGGLRGYDKVVWKAQPVARPDGPAVMFSYRDPDGANGYPGNVTVHVVYHLTDNDEVRLEYAATTDQATPLNLTNHAYFNLGTPASGPILDQILYLDADHYTPIDSTLIPTGEIAAVKGTPYDFTQPTKIGSRISQVGANPTGYDHNYVINGPQGLVRLAARAADPKSGRVMEVYTDQPGVQLYTGNFLDGTLTGKNGVVYNRNGGFTLETQHFPDSIHQPKFPNAVLRPGDTFHSVSVYKFLRDL